MVCKFENVSFRYVETLLLNQVTFSFTDTDKIGIMGVNGTGKSTLLKLILGIEKPQSGNISFNGTMRINYLPQLPNFSKDSTIFECIMQYSTKDNPIMEYEVKAILNKFKLNNYNATIQTLSGGEKKRLSIAIALLKPCDMLLLDEPTNHLDADSIVFLEKYLGKYKHGLILVTHDRYFLERVCNKMIEIDHGKVFEYNANYSTYLELKEQRMLKASKEEEKVKAILKKELLWIRAGVQARSTKQKSRIDRFNKLSEIEFKHDSELQISSLKTRLGNKLIEMDHLSKSMDHKVLFQDFSFLLSKQDRIGIVGQNGCGKSTLFKIIMGKEKPDAGSVIKGETLRIGYLSQELDEMNLDDRVIDYIKDESDEIETLDGKVSAKTLLETFLFDGEKQYSKIKSLSGGEKRRLQLVRVLMSNPNLLILDEPTNDLDIYTLELLENYLDSFYGPVIVVSHDRYFLDKVCEKLLVFENQQITPYFLSYSEYLNNRKDDVDEKEKKVVAERVRTTMPTKLKNELANIEPLIEKLETKRSTISSKIDNGNDLPYEELMDLVHQKDALDVEIEEKTNRYFELLEIKENYDHKKSN